MEANSKLLRQITVSNELHRDLHENEIKWLNIGISVETVEQFLIFTKMDPAQQKFFVENINGVEYLVDKGLNIEKLFSMNFEQQKLFIEHPIHIAIWYFLGQFLAMDMDFDQQKFFIENRWYIEEVIKTGISLEQFVVMSLDQQKLFIKKKF